MESKWEKKIRKNIDDVICNNFCFKAHNRITEPPDNCPYVLEHIMEAQENAK